MYNFNSKDLTYLYNLHGFFSIEFVDENIPISIIPNDIPIIKLSSLSSIGTKNILTSKLRSLDTIVAPYISNLNEIVTKITNNQYDFIPNITQVIEVKKCLTPSTYYGYSGKNNFIFSDINSTNLIMANFDGNSVASTLKCQDGFSGTPIVSICDTSNTPFKLSGCNLDSCTIPTNLPGYIINNNLPSYQLDFNKFDSNVTNYITCAPGYIKSGDIIATKCSTKNTPFTITGCIPIQPTTTPVVTTPVVTTPVVTTPVATILPPTQSSTLVQKSTEESLFQKILNLFNSPIFIGIFIIFICYIIYINFLPKTKQISQNNKSDGRKRIRKKSV